MVEKYLIECSSSAEALLEEAPTSAADENAQQPQTRFNLLQWWWQWWQPQPQPQHSDAMPASDPPQSDHKPTTIEQATEALVYATRRAGFTALCGAYSAKCRGSKADVAFAEASGAIALATATAAYAAADTDEDPYLIENIRYDDLTLFANSTLMSAEAAYAAAGACSTMPLSLTSIVNLFAWRWSPLSTHPYCNMDNAIDSIVTAAATSAAAAQSAIEAALAANTTTTLTATGFQAPYDPKHAARLYIAGRLAQASASAASAAASAVRATHPALATRATHAAHTAVAASANATITRLKLLTALSQLRDPLVFNFPGDEMRKWLTTLKTFKSKTAQFELRTCLYDLGPCPQMQCAAESTRTTSLRIAYQIKAGRIKVTTTDSAYAPDILDDSSSVTVGASTPIDDENIDSSNDL